MPPPAVHRHWQKDIGFNAQIMIEMINRFPLLRPLGSEPGEAGRALIQPLVFKNGLRHFIGDDRLYKTFRDFFLGIAKNIQNRSLLHDAP